MALTIADAQFNPVVVSGTTTTAAAVFTDERNVTSIFWDQPTTQGHKLSITNTAGKEFTNFYCQTANSSQHQHFGEMGVALKGCKFDDMDSGKVFIYWR